MKNVNEKSTVSTVAKVNNTEIVIIENGEKRVAIKPICDALGVDFYFGFSCGDDLHNWSRQKTVRNANHSVQICVWLVVPDR